MRGGLYGSWRVLRVIGAASGNRPDSDQAADQAPVERSATPGTGAGRGGTPRPAAKPRAGI